MWSLAATTLLFLASGDIEVQLLSGDKLTGQLVTLADGKVTLKSSESLREFVFAELLAISRPIDSDRRVCGSS